VNGTDAKKQVGAIILAFFLAAGGGIWAGIQHRSAQAQRADAEALRTVTSGIRKAGELFSTELAGMKQAALVLPESTAFSRGILLWVELEATKGGASSIKRTMLNPDWHLAPGELEAVQSYALPAALSYVNEAARWRELRRGRTELVRVKKSRTGPAEWLAFAFGTTQTAPALGADFGGSAILVFVDPLQTFARLSAPAPGLSGYLASSDGHVLVHSRSDLAGTDIGATSYFQAAAAAIQARADKKQTSLNAPAVVKAIPAEAGAVVTLAASKVSAFPLYLVVEKQLRAPPVTAATQAISGAHPAQPRPARAKMPPGRELAWTILIGVAVALVIYLI
jgi:hypothetical protein